MVNLSTGKNYLRLLYKDTVKVYSVGTTTTTAGATRPGAKTLKKTIIADVKTVTPDGHDDTQANFVPSKIDVKIICGPENIDIVKGDFLECSKKNYAGETVQTINCYAAKFNFYQNHIEILAEEKNA